MVAVIEVKARQHTIKAVIRPGEESGYVAECLEISVMTQGQTLDEVLKNLQEAVALHLEGEDLTQFGLAKNPTLLLTMEVEPAYAPQKRIRLHSLTKYCTLE
jgi:predicted RNase H-like HicB family nuclease